MSRMLPESKESSPSSRRKQPRRIAYVFIPHFRIEVERKKNPSLAGRPVIVGGQPHESLPVLDASPEAEERGVQPEMPLRHAASLCPEASFLPLNEELYQTAFTEVLQVLDSFSPKVEPGRLGAAYLDVTGSRPLFGEDPVLAGKIVQAVAEKTGFTALVGVAGTKFAARMAALISDPQQPLVVEESREPDFLKSLPVDILTEDEDVRRRLHLLGIDRVEDFRELPPQALPVQFGKQGQVAYQLALGVDNNPVLAHPQPPTLDISQTYWDGISDFVWLNNELGELLDELASRLAEGAWMCQEVALHFDLTDDHFLESKVRLREPTASAQALKDHVRQKVERQIFGAAVTGIKVTLSGLTSLDGKQLSLETMPIKQKARLRKTIEYLKAKYGAGRIKMAILLDPASLVPSERFALAEYGQEPAEKRKGEGYP